MDVDGTYVVSDLARLSGVSVRTLHHYDEIGILVPSGRTPSGYRVYSRADAERLGHVLAYRACGVPLADIRVLLDAPGLDRAAHLRRQLDLLDGRAEDLDRQRTTLRRAWEAAAMGIHLDPDEILDVFGEQDPTQYAAEVESRWGETDAYRESRQRTSAYSAADWRREQEEASAVRDEIAACMDAGLPADSARAMDAAEAHRRHIDAWFYPCSHDMQTGLADMYVSDERFAAHYDAVRPGLAAYLRAAIWANAVERAS